MPASGVVLYCCAGGAGYILGKGVLDRLVSHTIHDSGDELSITQDLRHRSATLCHASDKSRNLTGLTANQKSDLWATNEKLCVGSMLSTESQLQVPISVRLIDVCTSVMSGEYTCHHR